LISIIIPTVNVLTFKKKKKLEKEKGAQIG